MSDFLGGVQSRRLPVLEVMLITQLIGLAGVLIALALRGAGPPDLVRLLPAAASGMAGIAGLTAFYRALAIGTMSIVAPIAATGVAVPVIVGVAGGDRLGTFQVAGILAATLGVVLTSRDRSADAQARIALRTSVGLALVAAVGFGTFFVGLRASARADVLWALLAGRATGVAGLVLVTAFVIRRLSRARPSGRALRGALVPFLAMGILDVAANALYALASRHGLLSLVAVLGSLYPVATVLLARAFLGERVDRVQELGIITALAGVAMIAAG